jgi:nicotinamide mononucleotide transporter
VIQAWWTQFAATWYSTSWVEIAAVALALLYLVLAIRQNIACWAAAFVSSCLYVIVLFGARLYMESALNVFYAAMAVYGFRQWRASDEGGSLRVCRWPLRWHAAGLAGIVLASFVSSTLLRSYTTAAWPFVDSLVTWASVFATFLVARKVYENWHWWLVIDSAAMVLYFTRHLYATMTLFALYLVLIVVGMREWRRMLRHDAAASLAPQHG